MPVITIDGPTASGKSSAAQGLANVLGYYHLNSGLLFRGLAYVLMQKAGYTVEQLEHIQPADLGFYLNPQRFQYYFNGSRNPVVVFSDTDITPFLKSSIMDKAASMVGLNPQAREALCGVQRRIANNYSVVVDGRDCGSFVFPTAQAKFFLTAPADIRAQRWLNSPAQRALNLTLEQALQNITERDKRDSERPLAPLRIPEGAIMIDNGGMSLEETVAKMASFVAKR